ncbi:MAG: redox-regulated ATPase YchF [Turneriella sp.]|nr:redox-regulated ATPase YchF [Leptospiraceae bacterium]MCX7632209.1 redox-regulated ATPase YchF [Turneriella sp.]
MPLQCGIVGLPNAGKSTIFNALTRSAAAQAANYPFCTIEPNVGVVPVPDPRFDFLVETIQPKNRVPATVEFVDIAGLVKGAAQGEGLGNQFLDHIRRVHAVLHVVRCFSDPNVSHVAGKISPKDDVETIELELILSDLEQVQKRLEHLAKKKKAGDKDAIALAAVLERIQESLQTGQPASKAGLSAEERLLLRDLMLLTLKPVLFIGNIDEEFVAAPEKSPYFQELEKLAQARGSEAIPLSGKIEAELAQLSPEEEKEFLRGLGLKEPGLHRVIRKAYALLGYITFFTAGENEVRAWNILRGTTAPQAAGIIHSDIERGFIRAEVTPFAAIQEYGSEKKAREAGKMRLEGKDYIVEDGDVIYFRFNV